MNVDCSGNALVIELDSEAETERLGRALADVAGPGVVIGLIGPLGAGKTRLVRAVAEHLGVDPLAIASPTFVLIHEYEGSSRSTISTSIASILPGVRGPGPRRLLGCRRTLPGRVGRQGPRPSARSNMVDSHRADRREREAIHDRPTVDGRSCTERLISLLEDRVDAKSPALAKGLAVRVAVLYSEMSKRDGGIGFVLTPSAL